MVQLFLAPATFGQRLVPIADPVDQVLLPSGLSQLDVTFSAPLSYIFKDDAGENVLHFLGEFSLRLGDEEGPQLYSREAVVWISDRELDGRSYRHLDILLWRDAEIYESGGTLTTGPALFVTMNTMGLVRVEVDEVARRASTEAEAFVRGKLIRQAIANGLVKGFGEDVVFRVLDVGRLGNSGSKEPKPRPIVQIRSEGELSLTETEQAGQVLTVTGGVYVSRGVPESGDHLEIRAESVVVFLRPAEHDEEDAGAAPAAGLGKESDRATSSRSAARRRARRAKRRDKTRQQRLSSGFGEVDVEGVYLEGDVIMTQGANTIRASRLYYDFLDDRAVILDAVVRTTMAERNLPLYLRAAEVRQVSRGHFIATDAQLTTSEFHTPHYHIGARRVELTGLTPADPAGGAGAGRAGRFDIRHASLNLGGVPVFYLPHIRGNLDTSETGIESIRTGFSGVFGLEVETDWHLFHMLGLETPEGFSGTLSLDYFSERGPAIGVDVDYERDRYFGFLKSYLLSDGAPDQLGRRRETLAQRDVRGRFLLRHRQYLEDDWQLSLELSYISGPGFLEEFFEKEFDNDKAQETLLYLKKQREDWAFTFLLQARILDFTSQVERLPDLAYHVIGRSIGKGATWFSENRLGVVRLRPADLTLLEFLREGRTVGSGSVTRLDTRQEVEAPIDLGPLRLVPFAALRGTAWDDSREGGGLARVFGTYGVRGSLYLSRTYPDTKSILFDLDGVRHIIKSDIVAWASHSNRNSDELFQFDDNVEGIDRVGGVTIGFRQRWQTRRGQGDNRRVVDFLTLDTELGFFSGADGRDFTNGFTSFTRPENSVSRNHLNTSIIWRLNDRTALLSEVNYDINDGEVDVLNFSMAVERSPRMSYVLGYRFIEENNSNLFGFDMNYRLTEKHSLAIRELFDMARGETLDFTIALIRKFPRWFGAMSFSLDESEDDFGVSFSIWPEGLPRAALGSTRFTGVANMTGLRRN